jgi:ribonuclease E
MSKKMLIDATHAEETRVVVVDGNRVEEFDFETVNKRQIAGNIYLAKVTRVEPSLQAAFVDYGGNRHGFLAFAEIHPDYYQIPIEDRKALLEEERALNRAEEAEEDRRAPREDRPDDDAPRKDRRTRGRGGRDRRAALPNGDTPAIAENAAADAVLTGPELPPDLAPELMQANDGAPIADPAGMEVLDLSADDEAQPQDTPADSAPPQPADLQDAPETGETSQDDGETAFRAIDHASDSDDDIESIAEEDIAEEIAAPRRPRARRYKIQEVIKVRQIMLVQVVKEERGNKGAALTTYLSLAGRYCVLMPNTARGGGISRKIVQAADRKKLKEIAQEIEVPEGAGLIIRTAGAKRTKPEIKRDYEYLMRLWEQIRELTLKSMAPAAIYEEGDLIKRTIRDLYSSEIDEILVEGEGGYRTAKDFMRMIMPAHAKQVVRYTDPTSLFARYGVESYLAGMFNPTVQLKSGGYIVIGITEALVAVDVNSGRATKEGSIEDTALKTNLEAADEVARQLRLRDLAGLIVIDFIDMEERRNNLAVEKRLKDRLKTDRARIQVGRISGFGLMEMSRQRLRPGMLESTTQPCPHCHGTGLIRSDDSLGLQILRALEEEGTRKRSGEVLLRAPIGIINFLINNKREHIALIEARTGMSIRLECDPSLISPDYSIEKFKTATRVVADTASSAAISGNASLMGAPVAEDEFVEDDIIEDAAAPEASEAAPKADSADGNKKRRRRRRRKPRNGAQTGEDMASGDEDDGDDTDTGLPQSADVTLPVGADAVDEKPASKRTRAPRGGKKAPAAPAIAPATIDSAAAAVAEAFAPPADSDDAPAPKAKAPRARKPAAAQPEDGAKPARAPRKPKAASDLPASSAQDPSADLPQAIAANPAPEPAPVAAPAQAPVQAPDQPPAAEKPRKKGWWNLG